ncbi:MAG: energy-coupling factor ABC transporter permease [Candidatus Omnitrophota bacterium]
MHISSSMLAGPICPVTVAVSALGICGAVFAARKMKDKPTAVRFGAVTAFIFASQMMNFPVQSGTSGHLLGGVLAAALMGTPLGVLSISIVLFIQCLAFSDGGLSVLGANILNMAVIGTGVGGLIYKYLTKATAGHSIARLVSLGFAAWLSVLMAALACSIELAITGTMPFSRGSGAMISVHALIGVPEGIISVAAYYLLSAQPVKVSPKWAIGAPLLGSVVIGAMLSPFAAGFPDGLDWVAQKYQFFHESAPAFVSPMPDYTVPFIHQPLISTGLAGLCGVLMTFLFGWAVAKFFSRKTAPFLSDGA